MTRLSEVELKRLIKGGETTTVELKLTAPRPVEMAKRLCGMASAQGGVVIFGVRDSDKEFARPCGLACLIESLIVFVRCPEFL